MLPPHPSSSSPCPPAIVESRSGLAILPRPDPTSPAWEWRRHGVRDRKSWRNRGIVTRYVVLTPYITYLPTLMICNARMANVSAIFKTHCREWAFLLNLICWQTSRRYHMLDCLLGICKSSRFFIRFHWCTSAHYRTDVPVNNTAAERGIWNLHLVGYLWLAWRTTTQPCASTFHSRFTIESRYAPPSKSIHHSFRNLNFSCCATSSNQLASIHTLNQNLKSTASRQQLSWLQKKRAPPVLPRDRGNGRCPSSAP